MNPVLLVPGLYGSRLIARNRETGETQYAWAPPIGIHMKDDAMMLLRGMYDAQEGIYKSFTSSTYDIYPDSGLRAISMLSDHFLSRLPPFKQRVSYFCDLIQFLVSIGYEDGVSLFAFPYDWRQDVTGPLVQEQFATALEGVRRQTGRQVNVISHSMGGILVTQYLRSNKEQFAIGKFITLGTPFNGAGGGFTALTNCTFGCLPCFYCFAPCKRTNGAAGLVVNLREPSAPVSGEKLVRAEGVQAGDSYKAAILGHIARLGLRVHGRILEQLQDARTPVSRIFSMKNLRAVYAGAQAPKCPGAQPRLTYFQHFENAQPKELEIRLCQKLLAESDLPGRQRLLDLFDTNPQAQLPGQDAGQRPRYLNYRTYLENIYPPGQLFDLVCNFDLGLMDDVRNRMSAELRDPRCVQFYSISGVGIDTKHNCVYKSPVGYRELLFTEGEYAYATGDGTVTAASALCDDFDAVQRVVLNGVSHRDLLRSREAFRLIAKWLCE